MDDWIKESLLGILLLICGLIFNILLIRRNYISNKGIDRISNINIGYTSIVDWI